jgi:hypothetical protein
MSYWYTEEPTFKAVAAMPKFTQVIATSTADTVDVAIAASTKIIGYTLNQTFAAGDTVAVRLNEGKPRIGIASAAIAVGAFVEVTADGEFVTAVGTTELVALTAASGDGALFTLCKCGAKGV